MIRWLWLLVVAMGTLVNPVIGFTQQGDAVSVAEMMSALHHAGIELLVNGLINRSRTYALDFQFDAAVADMDTAIALDPDDPMLYVERGQRILLLYEWDRVLADYDKAIELDPTYANAYYYRGVLFYTQGPRDRAIFDFERYLELAPDGEHADNAAQYVENIWAELEAIEGSDE